MLVTISCSLFPFDGTDCITDETILKWR